MGGKIFFNGLILILLSEGILNTPVIGQVIIRPSTPEVTKIEGSSAVFFCEASSLVDGENKNEDSGNNKLQWFGNNGAVINDTAGRIYVEAEGPTTKKLYFTLLRDEDAGNYTCVYDLIHRNTITLEIFQDISIHNTSTLQYMDSGEDGLIECFVIGNPKPTIRWKFGSHKINSSTDPRYSIEREGLSIRNVSKSDAGSYKCRAEMEQIGLYQELTIYVHVNYAPEVLKKGTIFSQYQGRSTQIWCSVTAFPIASIYWEKDGQRINESDKFIVNNEEQKNYTMRSSLQIKNLEQDDYGVYQCVASNSLGVDRGPVVLCDLIPQIQLPITQLDQPLGNDTFLECFGTAPFIRSMFWLKNGQRINSSDKYRYENHYKNFYKGISKLHISNLTQEEFGIYHCVVENKEGLRSCPILLEGVQSENSTESPSRAYNKSCLITINIRKHVRLHPTDTDLKVYSGMSASDPILLPDVHLPTKQITQRLPLKTNAVFTCFVTLPSNTSVHWELHGRKIVNSGRFRIQKVLGPNRKMMITLRIRNLTNGDLGLYNCVAKNSIVAYKCPLRLSEASQINSNSTEEIANRKTDESLSNDLYCQATINHTQYENSDLINQSINFYFDLPFIEDII